MKKQLYQVIWGNSTSDLSIKVNAELKFGWKVTGGVTAGRATTLGQTRDVLYQAVFKED